MAQRKTKLTIGAVIGSIPVVVGAGWALATTAADHVMAPHKADAKQRVHVMCVMTKLQNRKLTSICESVGAKDCASFDAEAEALLASGCEEDGK
jgi:hypothetical protein